jgi:thymidylate synthase (FAD)
MEVKLMHCTPLDIADKAIGKCWDKQCNTINYKRLKRVGVQHKHESTLEHISYNFDIDGISRACLQELARHRVSSFSVKSSRYTLDELMAEDTIQGLRKFLVSTGNKLIDDIAIGNLHGTRKALLDGVEKDIAKFTLPEAYKTSLVWTVNLRSLRNFLALRSSKRALWEIRDLATAIYRQIPEDHKFLVEDCMQEKVKALEVTPQIRAEHFGAEGSFAGDEEILRWYNEQ